MLDRFNAVTRTELYFGVSLCSLIITTLVIYWPGIEGPLLLDDFWNLRALGEGGGVDSLAKVRQFVFSNESGPTGRPISMLSFLIDAQDWPLHVAALKYTNIMLHLLCGLSICWFSYLLSQLLDLSKNKSALIALVVSAIWLLHPLNISTVLYVVQRMTQLMTLFSMAALICFLIGRSLIITSPKKAMFLLCLCLFPFGLLAVLSKENGALLLLLIVILETTLFRERALTALYKFWFLLGVLLPLVIVFGYLLYTAPESLALYEIRNFNLGERLLTETRILLTYLWKIFLPTIQGNSLFHDDIEVSRSLFQPITTLFSLLIIAALFCSGFLFRRRYAVYSFAVFWFFAMHILESSYVPLELYFEHRNYMAMIGPLFALVWSLTTLVSRHPDGLFSRVVPVIASLVAVISIWLSWSLANTWSDSLLLHSTWAEEKPRSIRAQSAYTRYLNLIDLSDEAMRRLEIAHSYYPKEITVQLHMWNQSCEYGNPTTVTLREIAESQSLEYYRDDVNYYLKILIENMNEGRCEFPDRETMVKLFESIGKLPLPDMRKVGYYINFSDYYVFSGMLDEALINLSRAYELDANPRLPMRQAVLSASAGNYADSLVFLERAKQADSERNPLLPSLLDEISSLENDFKSRL